MATEPNNLAPRPVRVNWDPSIGLRRLDGDADLMSAVVRLLASTMQERGADMTSAAQEGRYIDLRQHAHSMLASLKVLGFDDEARVFEAYEAAAVISDVSVCQRLAPQVHGLWGDIVDALSAYPHAAQV